jgi:hypothetical protein
MTTFSKIPLQPIQPQTLRVTLQGVEYTFKVAWNPVAQIWMLDIYSSDATVAILRGIPLVTGADLLEQFNYIPIATHAALLAITTGPGTPPDETPTFTNLGIDGQLIYVSP